MNTTNWTFTLVDINTLPLKETITAPCVSIPNILGILITAFVFQVILMFLIARFPLNHKYDKEIRQFLVILNFVVLCFLGISIYFAYTF